MAAVSAGGSVTAAGECFIAPALGRVGAVTGAAAPEKRGVCPPGRATASRGERGSGGGALGRWEGIRRRLVRAARRADAGGG
ncbi:hypothetical protein TPA0906_27400 [Streptomyces olivaceus]|nr:hypothetical protein TPA0906_27400 [Streptomyces olivaceus]